MAVAARAAAVFGAQKQKEARESRQLRSVFEKYDSDKSGKLDKDELLGALIDLDVKVKLKELESFVASYGLNDKIKFEAFEKLLIVMQDLEDEKQADLERMYGCTDGASRIPFQREMIAIYNHPAVVYTVAAVIISNFLLNVVEKEIDPTGKPELASTWNTLDAVFNIIFLVELLMNMWQYAGPRRRFWRSPWNWFDTFIVFVGVMLMIGGDSMPAPLKKLKLLRALRVFRLFKRVKSLNKIIVALIASIPGVMNAFVIMVIFFCIYAILAVELFAPFGDEGEYPIYYQQLCETSNGTACAIPSPAVVSSMTARGYTNGYEYYGTFSRALYTLFQVMTGESWSEAIARPLVFGYSSSAFVASAYFVSFIILTQIVLMNVVVAVLLDNFASGPSEEDIEEKIELAELVRRMETKEAEARYAATKDEVTLNVDDDGTSSSSAPLSASVMAPTGELVKMPPTIAKLPTDKGDMHEILQLLKRMEARMAAIELEGQQRAANGGLRPAATRLPAPAPGVGASVTCAVSPPSLRA